MKNVINEKDKQELIKRVDSLKTDDKALFGKMNCHQMVCHSADQIRMALGIIKTDFAGNAGTVFMRHLILLGMPAPRGKIETVKELKQGAGGTPPAEFGKDKASLSELIDKFDSLGSDKERIVHPAFGAMNKKQWGRLVYIHADYHLKQFGK